MFERCPWNEVMTGVAWGIWHDRALFEEMRKAVSCGLGAQPSVIGHNDRRKWFGWLTEQNRDKTAYNIHLVWLWYFNQKVLPTLVE